MYLGIEIGGTKLQVGLGPGDGVLAGLWRATVDVAAGPQGIRKQITSAIPELLSNAKVDRSRLKAVGIGFGGPVDDSTRTIIKSHQIEGWDNFPLADWVSEVVGLPAVLGNDADVAGLAEALHGAGKGFSPVFYMTIGSGIGGGLIIGGEIYRGVGRGAAEIGHLQTRDSSRIATLESVASGWGMQQHVKASLDSSQGGDSELSRLNPSQLTVQAIAFAAERGDPFARHQLDAALDHLADGICNTIALLCPRRFVIGGGVSLLGERILFEPLRRRVAERVFRPFVGLTDIVPAALGEEVVVHGALALARKRLQ